MASSNISILKGISSCLNKNFVKSKTKKYEIFFYWPHIYINIIKEGIPTYK